jgi:hypothetical protein
MTLQELMQRAGVWRAGELPPRATRPSGFPALDQTLPGGGWPRTGLTEILSSTFGIGALRLVLPELARLSQQGHWIILVNPPHIPYSPALLDEGVDLSRLLIVDLPTKVQSAETEILWAYEQALRFEDCAAALLWLDDAPSLHMRRLQLAAETGATWGVVFRPVRFSSQPSPAVLRLKLDACPVPSVPAGDLLPHKVDVTVLKARGASNGASCRVTM